MAPDQKRHINRTNGFDCTVKKKKVERVGMEVRDVEANVGEKTSQSGCKVMLCVVLHASIENIGTGR